MKIPPRQIERFLSSPGEGIRVVLVYGENRGLVRERVTALAKYFSAGDDNPHQVTELTASDVQSDPARLVDQTTQGSLLGGDRMILVRLANEDISAPLRTVLAQATVATVVILEAGDLSPRSVVRKLCEADQSAAVIACYGDNAAALGQLFDRIMDESNKRLSPEARSYLLQNLGSDRMVSRREMEKLVLYVGDVADITLDDAVAAVGDSGALSVEEIIYAAAGGDGPRLDQQLSRAYQDGTSPVAVLRAAIRHFQRLQLAAGEVANGQSADQAMKSIRPPVLFFYADRFKRQLHHWTPDRIGHAQHLLIGAEIDCKSTGLPDQAVCGRALIRLCQSVK